MKRIAEIARESRAAHDLELIAEGSLREAVGAGDWTGAHRAVDELRAAREALEELEAEVEQLIDGEAV